MSAYYITTIFSKESTNAPIHPVIPEFKRILEVSDVSHALEAKQMLIECGYHMNHSPPGDIGYAGCDGHIGRDIAVGPNSYGLSVKFRCHSKPEIEDLLTKLVLTPSGSYLNKTYHPFGAASEYDLQTRCVKYGVYKTKYYDRFAAILLEMNPESSWQDIATYGINPDYETYNRDIAQVRVYDGEDGLLDSYKQTQGVNVETSSYLAHFYIHNTDIEANFEVIREILGRLNTM